jgi:hypothetical protein
VPHLYKDAELSLWVQGQQEAWSERNEGKITDLTDERINKLNALDFEWTAEVEYQSADI